MGLLRDSRGIAVWYKQDTAKATCKERKAEDVTLKGEKGSGERPLWTKAHWRREQFRAASHWLGCGIFLLAELVAGRRHPSSLLLEQYIRLLSVKMHVGPFLSESASGDSGRAGKHPLLVSQLNFK